MENNTIFSLQDSYLKLLYESSKELFGEIDKNLNPKIFFFCISDIDSTEKSSVIIYPETYAAYDFDELQPLAKTTLDVYLNKVNNYPGIGNAFLKAKNYKDNVDKTYKDILLKIFQSIDFAYFFKYERFVSKGVYIDDKLVFVIVELEKEIVNKYYSLTNFKDSFYQIHNSVIECITEIFLEECISVLENPLSIMYEQIKFTSIDEIKRRGAEIFVSDVVKRVCHPDENFRDDFYQFCNRISSLKYEGEEGFGKMIIANENHDNIRYLIRLEIPIQVNDKNDRKIRKLLELCDDELLMISDTSYIYGLGEIFGNYNSMNTSLFIINFLSHHKWELLHDNKSLMVVNYNIPQLLREKIDRNNFSRNLKNIFNGIKNQQITNLWEIVTQATKQRHGTMLVITNEAKNEALRLGNQSFKIEPTKITKDLIKRITSIDGAVLLDIEANCYAIGVILDGIASENGDSSRGARYNSAIRYYDYYSEKFPLSIIIISEDGMIDIIPPNKLNVEEILEGQS